VRNQLNILKGLHLIKHAGLNNERKSQLFLTQEALYGDVKMVAKKKKKLKPQLLSE
jgi:hypothetical protein